MFLLFIIIKGSKNVSILRNVSYCKTVGIHQLKFFKIKNQLKK